MGLACHVPRTEQRVCGAKTPKFCFGHVRGFPHTCAKSCGGLYRRKRGCTFCLYGHFVRTFCTDSRAAPKAPKHPGKTVLRFSLNPFPAWKPQEKISKGLCGNYALSLLLLFLPGTVRPLLGLPMPFAEFGRFAYSSICASIFVIVP